MNKKTKKSAIYNLIAVMFLVASMAIGTVNAYAVEVEGSETGLRVYTSDVLVPTDNLGPGDTKTSSMKISLDRNSSVGENTLPVWMSAEIVENIPGKSFDGKRGYLDDVLEFTITHENGEVLYNKGSASGLSEPIVLGQISKGDSFDVFITVHLPGEETGNEYQAASLKVKWKIITMYTPGTEPTDPTSTEPTTTEPTSTEPTPTEPVPTEPTPTESESTEPTTTEPIPTEPTITESTTQKSGEPTSIELTQTEPTPTPITDTVYEVEDEPVPEGSPEPELEIIEEEIIPSGLPKTGELPPALFYGLGAGIIYLGIKLNRKKR
ncbi:MAG: hypothetical protein GX045_07555 [Clostridiaceae bacterium]|nr:hypothetical protein [Clostridiaceae bacterium]